ncbi:MAG: tetratricopeptide repeat protein, partial [Candidatus Parabeggiatoa sp.]|nr:tetratricopeptide repeat protein [Candidatus Parabeggiatoa sp.]
MKKLTAYLFIVLLMSLLAPVTVAYDPDDLMRLIRIKKCVGCDLSGVNLNPYLNHDFFYFFHLEEPNLKGANLEGANLKGANLEGANLYQANLYQTNLEMANLESVNLQGANLQKANLINAKLWSANLENANLQEAKLDGTNFWNAKLIKTIISRTEFSKIDQGFFGEPSIRLGVKFSVETIVVKRSGEGYWNKFQGLSGKDYEIKVDNINRKADVVIRLYDSSLNLLKTVDEHLHAKSEKLVWTAPQWNDEDYYVNIRGTHLDKDSYKLQVYELVLGDDIPLTGVDSTILREKKPPRKKEAISVPNNEQTSDDGIDLTDETISSPNNGPTSNDEYHLENTELQKLLKKANKSKELGQYNKALGSYNKVLPLVQKLGDKKQEGSTLNLIGEMHHNLGQSKEALEIYAQALTLYEKVIDDKSLAGETLINLGAVYSDLYQHKKALNCYERSVKLFQKAKDQNGEGIALANMGNAFYNMEKYQQALTHYQQALKRFQKTSDSHNKGGIFLNLGNTHLSLGQYQKALESYQEAQRIYNTIEGVADGDALAFCGIGYVEKILGQYEQALLSFKNCLKILKRFEPLDNSLILDNLWLAQAQLAFVETHLNKHKKAVRHYRQALDSIESLRTTLSSEANKLLFIQDKYYVYDEFIQLLQSLHQRYPIVGYNYESLKVFEKKQGRIFVEKIAKSGARRFANLPLEKADYERELEDQLAKIRADFINKWPELNNEQKQDEIGILVERFKMLKKEQQSFREKLEDDFFDYYTLKYPQPATLETLQNRVLKEGEMFLIYGVMEKKTVLWAVGKGYFEMFTLSGEAALKKQVYDFLNVINIMQKAVKKASQLPFTHQDLQDWLVQKNRDTLPELIKISHSLYQTLLPVEVHKRLEQAKLVYIVPTGPLYALPFEALVTLKKKETPHYLIQDFAIAYLSSASLLKTLRDVQARRKNKASQPLLAFANPDFPPCAKQNIQKRSVDRDDFIGLRTQAYQKLVDGCFRHLPETEKEVTEIAHFLKAPLDKALKLHEAATRENVLKTKLDDYRYLVFATHALLPHKTNNIAQPALVLTHNKSQDEQAYLTMVDVLGLKL